MSDRVCTNQLQRQAVVRAQIYTYVVMCACLPKVERVGFSSLISQLRTAAPQCDDQSLMINLHSMSCCQNRLTMASGGDVSGSKLEHACVSQIRRDDDVEISFFRLP